MALLAGFLAGIAWVSRLLVTMKGTAMSTQSMYWPKFCHSKVPAFGTSGMSIQAQKLEYSPTSVLVFARCCKNNPGTNKCHKLAVKLMTCPYEQACGCTSGGDRCSAACAAVACESCRTYETNDRGRSAAGT